MSLTLRGPGRRLLAGVYILRPIMTAAKFAGFFTLYSAYKTLSKAKKSTIKSLFFHSVTRQSKETSLYRNTQNRFSSTHPLNPSIFFTILNFYPTTNSFIYIPNSHKITNPRCEYQIKEPNWFKSPQT
jgi:hypothetical protein